MRNNNNNKKRFQALIQLPNNHLPRISIDRSLTAVVATTPLHLTSPHLTPLHSTPHQVPVPVLVFFLNCFSLATSIWKIVTPSALAALAASYVLNVCCCSHCCCCCCFGFFVFMAQTVWPFIFMWRSCRQFAVALVAVAVSAVRHAPARGATVIWVY